MTDQAIVWHVNRSERARQAKLLAPILENPSTRRKFFSQIDESLTNPFTDEEIVGCEIIHFAWPIRDQFTFERNEALRHSPRPWAALRKRWTDLLQLPEVVSEPNFWSHPSGSFDGDPHFVVHPCHRTIGWTAKSLRDVTRDEDVIRRLVDARKVMNTEADSLVDTGRRLVFIECKDKTPFIPEQAERQQKLSLITSMAWGREEPAVHVEIGTQSRPGIFFMWEQLERWLIEQGTRFGALQSDGG